MPAGAKSLVDSHPSSSASALPKKVDPNAAHGSAGPAPHRGFALSVGANAAYGSGLTMGAEGAVGVAIDFDEVKVSVFTSKASGFEVGAGPPLGVSGQLSLVKDMTKFWGSGQEYGLNARGGGAALNYATDPRHGTSELNGVTGSVGSNGGVGARAFETTTIEQGSLSLEDVKNAFRIVSGLRGPLRFGP